MRITVDGIDYVPAGTSSPRIGVAITSRNRPQVLAETLAAFTQYSPDIPVIVIDDASDTPIEAPCTVVRNSVQLGIAQSKNRCIAELMKLGVQHLFLFDDDTRPQCPNWWKPYVDSPEPHLQHSWTHFANNKPVDKMTTIYQSDDLIAFGWSMGCMLYLTDEVVHRVGGMRAEFGPAMHEHIEFSRRICNAGLTSFPFQDVPNSSELLFAADRTQSVKSSITVPDRNKLLQRNDELLASLEDDTTYVPYAHRDIVLTCLFTAHDDPQRATRMKSDPRLAATLLNSLTTADVTVLCDFDTDHPHFTKVATTQNPYIQRWISYRQYLISHPEVRYVWCVDATDVECLQDPFPMMQPDTLYCGWENQIVGCPWMVEHHPSVRAWIDANSDRTLLNAGVVGGDRTTILTLINRILRLWFTSAGSDLADMGVFNQAAYSLNPITGPRITTLFKANQRNDFSLFRHK